MPLCYLTNVMLYFVENHFKYRKVDLVMPNTKEDNGKERILAFKLSEKFSLNDLKMISGGGKTYGTKEATAEATYVNGSSDVGADCHYDW